MENTMINRIQFIIFILLIFSVSRCQGMTLYISPAGDDSNSGSIEKPLATLEAARDIIRVQRSKSGICEPATVYLRGGTYRRSRTFELNNDDRYTTYKAYQPDSNTASPEKVTISGAYLVPAASIKPIDHQTVLERVVEPEARDHIRKINLKSLGIRQYGELGPRGFRRAYKSAPLELFIDGKPQQIARWPNPGQPEIIMGKVIDPGSIPREGDYGFRPGCFKYNEPRVERWTNAGDIYLSGIFAYGYADDTIPVAKIDTNQKTLSFAYPHMYGLINQSFTKWHALNLLEEIDLPGEYYVDSEAGILYFYPPENFSEESPVEVSLLDEPMLAIEDTSHVVFQCLTFEISRNTGVYIEGGSHNKILGCTLRNFGIMAVQIGQGIKPFDYGKHDGCGNREGGRPGEPASRLMGSWHEHIYKYTEWNRKAGTNHEIRSCDIYDCGAGGISLSGGDRRTLTAGHNAVINCDIYRVNRLGRTYKAPINIDGVGNRIAYCHLHHCPGMGVYLLGNDHIIEYNELDNLLTDISDQATIYMDRDLSEQGNQFRYNYFHHLFNRHKGGWGVQAIFFDDHCSAGAEIYGNVFFKAGSSSVIKFLGGGSVLPIHDNVMVDCPRPLENAGNNTDRVQNRIKTPLWQRRLLQAVDITKPPYSTKYPHLLDIYTGKREVTTPFVNNYVVNGDYSAFIDAERENFMLKPGGEAYNAVPGLGSIPFDKMGLKVDEYRTSLPPLTPHFETRVSYFIDHMSVVLKTPLKSQGIVYTLDGSEPSIHSSRYLSPIVLQKSTEVKARSIGQGKNPLLSNTVALYFNKLKATLASEACINFQPESANSIPQGWLVDNGKKFGLHNTNTAYGWNFDMSSATRIRGKNENKLLDTLIHYKPDARWEIAVENGTYAITVCIGDSEFHANNQTLYVEEKELCSNINLGSNEFKQVEATVIVNDNFLTITSNDAPHGPDQARLNWIQLKNISN